MRTPAFFVALAFAHALCVPTPSAAQLTIYDAVLTATLENEWAVEPDDPTVQKWETNLEPTLYLSLPLDLSFKAIGRLRADPFDELEPGKPSQGERWRATRRLRLGSDADAELRELYFEAVVAGWFVTAGKQQIVWGQADGLKVLDVVDPQDFREFILDDFADSRIPLWSLRVEVPLGSHALELVWVPDPTVHDIPEPGAAYEITARMLVPRAPPGFATEIAERHAPDRSLDHSDAGARLSTYLEGVDFSFIYLYRFDDVPVLRRRVALTPVPTVHIEPDYERTHLAGATFAKVIEDLAIRGEIGFTLDKSYSTRSVEDLDGIVRSDEYASVIGFDWLGFRSTFLSLQLFQTTLLRHEREMLRDRSDLNVTFFARRTFRNDTVTTQVMLLQGLELFDGLVRPKIAYRAGDRILLWLGADVFYGSGAGVFGQFSDRDRIVTGIELSL